MLFSLILGLIVVIANAAEAITGFGSTVITLTLAARFQPIESLIPVIIPLNILLSAYLVTRYFSYLNRKLLFQKILPFVGLGTIFGIFIETRIEKSHALELGFGILVIFYGLLPLIQTYRKQTDSNKKPLSSLQSFALLFSGGIAQGIFASGGPLVVAYSSKVIHDKKEFRTTLSTLWLILNSILMLSFLFQRRITVETLQQSAILLPAIIIGLLFGEWLHHRISELYFRRAVFFLLTLAGFALVLR